MMNRYSEYVFGQFLAKPRGGYFRTVIGELCEDAGRVCVIGDGTAKCHSPEYPARVSAVLPN